jgi:hypothetical protein
MKLNEILDLEERARHKGAFAPVLTQNIKHNYLKYSRIARIYVCTKHKIDIQVLEILMFVYSERPFSKKMLLEFEHSIFGKSRFNSLMYHGMITVFRMHLNKEKTLYTITHKGKQIMDEYYSILEGRNMRTILYHIQKAKKDDYNLKKLERAVKAAVESDYDPTKQRRPSL